MFSHYEIPPTLISDNGPQFSSAQIKEFVEAYGFHIITTIPHCPQANGQAEHMGSAYHENLLHNAKDPHMALLSYHATPLKWCGLILAELLMGRNIRTDLP